VAGQAGIIWTPLAATQPELDRTGKMDPDGERRIIAGGSWHTEKVRRPQRPDPSNWR